ncbi:MAG TPA: hypothetical protein VJI13_04845 [Candidatus Norongarragalinales archaeon]|nr:hypothetical protein [Candidatus Norongarragalinales archaeon]
MRRLIRTAFLLLAFMLLANSLTPEEFSERLGNLDRIRKATYLGVGSGAVQIPDIGPQINEVNSLYAQAYAAKDRQDATLLNEKSLQFKQKMEGLQPLFPTEISLSPLKDLALQALGVIPSPKPAVKTFNINKAAPDPTFIAATLPPRPSSMLIPTVPPEQLKGRKNILFALGDLMWENGLLIGVFIVGMLVVYALYSRQEEQSSYEYSGD